MSSESSLEPMVDMYLFETTQQVEQLEAIILESEKAGSYSVEGIHEIFRIMHTIKGSSGMMLYNEISRLAHGLEDLFYLIREKRPVKLDTSELSDIVLEGIDFIKLELLKIKNGDPPDGNPEKILSHARSYLALLKEQNPHVQEYDGSGQKEALQFYIPSEKTAKHQENIYKAVVYFEEGCEMENIRAYTLVHSVKDFTQDVYYSPQNLIDDDKISESIRENGFAFFIVCNKNYREMFDFLNQTPFIREVDLIQLEDDSEFKTLKDSNIKLVEASPIKVPEILKAEEAKERKDSKENLGSGSQTLISVQVQKLDALMDLVGELVITEAMVTQNPDLKGLQLDNFTKAARQLRKITGEIQDLVMAVRMVPLSVTFHKMHRLVRDMGKKLGKNVRLVLLGEETEVDKNIIEHISDPLMHLIRNAVDHGIEKPDERIKAGKPEQGCIFLEAKSAGNEVHVIVKDDGRGLSREKILKRAKKNGLVQADAQLSDKEILNLIFLPGFSTKEDVTEFSGRGVGMDVVTSNIKQIGGNVLIESQEGAGTAITLRIPLTMAIIDGMNIKVGQARYTIPTTSIKESFRPKEKEIFTDPDGREMVMVRGQCYPVVRLHNVFRNKTSVSLLSDGILIMVEHEEKCMCLFADSLLGQQQVVVKPLPHYLKRVKDIKGIAGCTLLGDGSISLIIDINGLSKAG